MRAPRLVAALALAGALPVGLIALGESVQRPPVPAGDRLGREASESWSSYEERAAASLLDAPPATDVFALVTFERGRGTAEAAAALEGADRVNAVAFPDQAARPVPEPVAGESREDVFRRAAGPGPNPEVAGVVVHADGPTLRAIAGREGVAAVEALPVDAVWGAFAIATTRP
ncbi:hypothetical protein [Corynebacterium senegalense]|uniref:hypothetical protein n=1 Tax=Corynebacterium senegalense TaxID=2080750 RepID=UPI000E2023E3|nr:hypothetical protein [Corynebacterium senegalense]